MIPFQVGDKVRVSSKHSPYSYSKYGSEGVVTTVDNNRSDPIFMVDFYLATGDLKRSCLPHHYRFYESESVYFSLLEKAAEDNPHNKKYEKIINKIEQLRAKRKAKGYVY